MLSVIIDLLLEVIGDLVVQIPIELPGAGQRPPALQGKRQKAKGKRQKAAATSFSGAY
jgi:hypothetical protein